MKVKIEKPQKSQSEILLEAEQIMKQKKIVKFQTKLEQEERINMKIKTLQNPMIVVSDLKPNKDEKENQGIVYKFEKVDLDSN